MVYGVRPVEELLRGKREVAVIYTALFVPFTYMIDRYAYRRYLAKQQGGTAGPTGKKPPAKKR